MAVIPAQGRDPSQREQILASQSLLPTEYMAPNYLTYGNAVSFGQNADVGLYPGKQYVLVDNRTGRQLAAGSSAEEIQNILSIINNELVPQGGKADWRLLDMGGAPTGATLDMHTALPSGFGEAVQVGDQYGIPIAGDRPNNFIKDMLIPLLTPIAATAGAYFGGNALLGAQGGGGAGAAGAGLGGGGGSAGLGAGTSLASQGLASLPANLAAIQAGANTALAGAGLGAGVGTAAAAAPSLLAAAPEIGTIVVTAPTAAGLGTIAPVAAGTGLTAGLLANAQPTALPEVGPMDTPQKPGILSNITKNLGISDYLTLGSLAASGIGSLFGGGQPGQAPYTSPFTSAAAGRDMRANPNIADYEQYGFGPEATFFKPEYNQLAAGALAPVTNTNTFMGQNFGNNAGQSASNSNALKAAQTAGMMLTGSPFTFVNYVGANLGNDSEKLLKGLTPAGAEALAGTQAYRPLING